MSKSESLYYKIAKNNSKLSNDVYKALIKRHKTLKKVSVKNFQEAFHSEHTPPEFRVLLLSSLYEPTPQLYSRIEILKPDQDRVGIYFDIGMKNGKKFLQLNEIRVRKKQWMGNRTLRLNMPIRKEIRAWKPGTNRNTTLTKTLLLGNVQSQKVAMLISQINTALYAFADMVSTNIRANDPERFYFDLTDRPFTRNIEDDLSKPAGDIQLTQKKFYSHLLHMKNELKKYEPTLAKLGVNLTDLQTKIDNTLDITNTFINTPFNDAVEESDNVYYIHEAAKDVLDEVNDVALRVDQIDVNDPTIYTLRRLENVPEFRDYNPKKLTYHRNMSGDKTVNAIRLINNMINKK